MNATIETKNIPVLTTGEGPGGTAWKQIVARYQQPSWWRAVWQLVNTLVPYAALWYLMYVCVVVSYWLVVPLSILAGGFMVRLFIIHHDCGHGSFFKSRRANDILGFITGVLTSPPTNTGVGNMPPIMRLPVIWTSGGWATFGR